MVIVSASNYWVKTYIKIQGPGVGMKRTKRWETVDKTNKQMVLPSFFLGPTCLSSTGHAHIDAVNRGTNLQMSIAGL
jgi:hypothetical protein